MKVAQIMKTELKTCRQSDMLDVAARLMWDFDIGAIPVIDDFGKLVGVVTDRDACMAAFMQHQPLHNVAASVAMNKHVITVRADDDHATVASLMARHKIRRVVVIDDDGRPIGIVSLNDLALAARKGQDVQRNQVADTLAAICAPRTTPPNAPNAPNAPA